MTGLSQVIKALVRVELELMAMNRLSTYQRAPELETDHQTQFSQSCFPNVCPLEIDHISTEYLLLSRDDLSVDCPVGWEALEFTNCFSAVGQDLQ